MDQDYINRVETYLKGHLQEDDKKKFEKDLNDDPVLQQAYYECKVAMDVIDRQVEHDLQSKFNKWEKEKPYGSAKARMFTALKIAASIVLLVGVYFIFFREAQYLSNQQLALQYYNLPETPDKTMGDNNQAWSQGIEAYNHQQYQAAIDNWLPIRNSNPEVSYFLAHSYFNIQQYQAAIVIFSELRSGSSIYSFNSEWNLILSYLANNQLDLFDRHLNQILEQPGHPFYTNAADLRDRFATSKDR